MICLLLNLDDEHAKIRLYSFRLSFDYLDYDGAFLWRSCYYRNDTTLERVRAICITGTCELINQIWKFNSAVVWTEAWAVTWLHTSPTDFVGAAFSQYVLLIPNMANNPELDKPVTRIY